MNTKHTHKFTLLHTSKVTCIGYSILLQTQPSIKGTSQLLGVHTTTEHFSKAYPKEKQSTNANSGNKFSLLQQVVQSLSKLDRSASISLTIQTGDAVTPDAHQLSFRMRRNRRSHSIQGCQGLAGNEVMCRGMEVLELLGYIKISILHK